MAILKLKNKFNQRKSPILIYDVNMDRIVVFNKVPFGKKDFKYFIGHKDDSKNFALVYYFSKNEWI